MRSLRFRLTLWFSLAVTVTAGSVAWAGFHFVRQQMMAGIDFLLEAEVQEVVARLTDEPVQLEPDELRRVLDAHTAIDAPFYYFQVRRIGQGVVYRSRNLRDEVLPDFADGGLPGRTIELQGSPARQFEQAHRDFHVQIATSLEQYLDLLGRFRHAMLVGFPVLFAASLAVGLAISAVALHPIRAMQQSAQRISATNLSGRLPVPPGADEIANLARLLNALFARLEASFEQIKRFTADASHELKTPLSLIGLHAEKLASSTSLDEAGRAEVHEQIEEIARLNRLVDSLLLLARADAGSLQLDLKRHDTAAYLSEFAEDATALAEDRGLKFVLAENESSFAAFDPVMIRQVLLNLLSNALRYSPPAGSIVLRSRVSRGAWEIVLEDEGPGIPASALESVFGRFVRHSTPDYASPSGSGLGLAIVRSIVESHRGHVTARNRTGGGLQVTVSLPGAQSAAELAHATAARG